MDGFLANSTGVVIAFIALFLARPIKWKELSNKINDN